jgi:PAS domain S-box-containing protein
MFSLLRTKLTFLYAGLFAVVLLFIAMAVSAAISENALRDVRRELATSSRVFDRVWALKTAQLENGAELLSRDFGFRAAMATGDQATIRSALSNLQARLGIGLAMTVTADGRLITAGDQPAQAINPGQLSGFEGDEAATGVVVMGDAPYELVSVPIRAPTTIGWVIFATRLDQAQMRSLEDLASIPLDARVFYRAGPADWRQGWVEPIGESKADLSRFIEASQSTPGKPGQLQSRGGPAVVLVKPLHSVDADHPVALVLQYPVARALAPYRLLMALLLGTGILGLVALLIGTWVVARGVTRPISALEDAARRLQRGEQAQVAVETQDEIGRLAHSFNAMAAGITQREAELESTRAFMDAVVENLPAMVVIKDLEHRFVLLNRAGEDLIGVSREEFIGKTDHDLFPADQADHFVERDRAVLDSGQLQFIPDEPIQTVKNGLRYLQTKKIAIRDADGRPQYLLAISEDITEAKAASEALALARDQAEAANRAKSSFLANMSHEVRTPLNGVLGVAGILALTDLAPRQRELVGIIENSAFVLKRVLNDVLDLARVEAGRMQIVSEPFDLDAAIHALAGSTKVQCDAVNLRFDVSMDDGASSMVQGDRVRLEQILGNLLSNALKFTSAGAIALTVTRDSAGDVCRFEVRDSGIGFEPELAEALFQPFQQADGSITRRFGGTGLGLSISRELAKAMGGDLSAVGVPGQGACFTLTVPLPRFEGHVSAPAPVSEQAPAYTQPVEGSAPIRVLLADDHETNRVVVNLILESIGADLVEVEDGAQAVEAFEAGCFDVVLMDMQMPVMDGLTAIGLIRAFEARKGLSRTPVLVLSANALPEHVQAARAAGADGHVAKPITPPMLIGAMLDILGGAAESDSSEREIA